MILTNFSGKSSKSFVYTNCQIVFNEFFFSKENLQNFVEIITRQFLLFLQLFERKIEENKKMVEDRKRPRYWEPTMASKARQKPPLRESYVPSTRYHNHNQHFAPPPKSSKRIHHHPEEVLVMKIPNSHSGQSVQYSWSSNSTSNGNPTEGELALMQTSSSSNESRSSAKKVVASYSNCALAQKPVFPGKIKFVYFQLFV